MSFYQGAKIGVLGLNGTGKSTLFRMLAGVDKDFSGSIELDADKRIGYLAQEPELDNSMTVHEAVMQGVKHKTDLLQQFEDVSMQMAEPEADFDALMAEQAQLQEEIDRLDAWSLDHKIEMAKAALRVPSDDRMVGSCSGGEKRRIAIAALLLSEPEVLLLDEPTNHLDAVSVAWLEDYLKDYKGTVLAITHDRYFLDHIAGWILELDNGRLYPYDGSYSTWLSKRQERMDMNKAAEAKRARAMKAELDWIRQGPKGQQAKGKARLQRYAAMKEEDQERRDAEKFKGGDIMIPPGPRVTGDVVKLKDVSYSLPDGTRLVDNLSFDMEAGSIVGVIGANGTGKSTLMRIVAGELPPSQGDVTLAGRATVGFVEQSRPLDPDLPVRDVVSEGASVVKIGRSKMPVMAYMSRFNIAGGFADKLIRDLSGGERSRVHLARTLKHPVNLLILDEPTNDLDVDTLRALEGAVGDYNGSAFVVSHDRYFLDRVCTHILAFEGDGTVIWHQGNYSDYEAFFEERVGRKPAAAHVEQGKKIRL